jgi:hypothetical protein
MTLVLVLQAQDGLLLVADGRTSRWPTEQEGPPIPNGNTTEKIVRVPGAPIAVLLTGRSTFTFQGNGRVVAEWCEKFLADEFGSPAEPPTVHQVADALRRRFAEIDEHEPGSADLTFLVAGYSPSPSGPEDSVVVRTELRGDGPRTNEMFARRGFCAEPDTWPASQLQDGLLGLTWDEMYAEAQSRGIDENSQEFQEHWDNWASAPHRLLGSTLEELRARLATGLPKVIAQNLDGFEGNGVGGRWTVLELVPGQPAAQTTTLIAAP